MTTELSAPTRREVEEWFTSILAGTRTRAEADEWAAAWHVGPAADTVDDGTVWWALGLLHGIDLTSGPGQPFLHDDQQVRQWLHEFRIRCDDADRESAR